MLKVMTKEESKQYLDQAWNLIKMKEYSLINDGSKTLYFVANKSSYPPSKDGEEIFYGVKLKNESDLISFFDGRIPFEYFKKSDFRVINVLI